MAPYRFSFETDQQYQARVGQLDTTPVVTTEPKESTPPTATKEITYQAPTTAAVVQPTPVTTSRTQNSLAANSWLMIILFLLLVVAFYESYRRKLTALLKQYGPPRLADEAGPPSPATLIETKPLDPPAPPSPPPTKPKRTRPTIVAPHLQPLKVEPLIVAENTSPATTPASVKPASPTLVNRWKQMRRNFRRVRLATRANQLGIENMLSSALTRYGWRMYHTDLEQEFDQDRPVRRQLGHWRVAS